MIHPKSEYSEACLSGCLLGANYPQGVALILLSEKLLPLSLDSALCQARSI